ncbi:glycosyltransferase family 2 protein [Thalassotalea sp. PS06]|uniref:glycosyltransferase family 2 protein n=1 Tax=Thalassotalea sp. PS06 TaxID=2594005 RepID=UPI0021B0A736|nr:glycosyltransferase family 2 protein [Thalassotalea sp. PS06]
MEFVFWIAVLAILYSYLIYPVLCFIFAKFFGTETSVSALNDEQLPAVSVVIAAYNEEHCIAERVENLLNQDYPLQKLHIFIGSDGSIDATNAILETLEHPCLNISLFSPNRGKASTLNDLLTQVETEIVVFSDANTQFEANAIRELVAGFSDPSVGAVCGELELYNLGTNANKDNLYWRYEQFIKYQESKLDALLGANGAIYAIRQELYTPISANTIVDDFQIVMNIARQGRKVVYHRGAKAREEVAPSAQDEGKRRIRIGAGNYQAFSNLFWLLNPKQGWRCFAYFSHKVLRWFTPHLMVLALVSNFLLATETFYFGFLLLQVTIYGLGIWGIKKIDQGQTTPWFITFIAFFLRLNTALMQGFVLFSRRNLTGTWQRTSRS